VRERRLAGQMGWFFGSDGVIFARVPGAGDGLTPRKMCFKIPIRVVRLGDGKKLINSGPFVESTRKHSIYTRLWAVLRQFPKGRPSMLHSAPVNGGNTRYW
jgi:hypothetical protein